MFFATIREEANDIYDWLRFDSEEDKIKLDIMIKKFEEFFVGDMHEANQSYKFLPRKPEASKSIESYIAALKNLQKIVTSDNYKIDLSRTRSLSELEIILPGENYWTRACKSVEPTRRPNNRNKPFLLVLMLPTLISIGLQRRETREKIPTNLERNRH